MMLPPKDSGNNSAKVVVCIPFKWAAEISPIFKSSFVSIAFTKVLFPTPLCPEINEVLSFNNVFINSISFLSNELTLKHSYPISV